MTLALFINVLIIIIIIINHTVSDGTFATQEVEVSQHEVNEVPTMLVHSLSL